MSGRTRSRLGGRAGTAAVAALLALAAAVAGCSGAQQAAPPVAAGGPGRATAQTSRVTPRLVTKLLVFVMENHSLRQMRSGMPYTARLARQYGYAVDYRAVAHPSLPDYLAIASGSTHGR